MTATTVPAAASPWVAERIAGPRAVYVDLDHDCLGVLARAAVALPIGLRTTLPRLPSVTTPIEVGDGRVAFGEYAITVTRVVDAAVPPVGPLPPLPPPVRLDLPAPALRALADARASAALGLLGRGDGLTPSGDDVLAGWLATRLATGRPTAPVADAVTAHAANRTTLLSATLLRRAAAGEVLPECRDLLLALRAGSGVDAALRRLLAVGHSSGAALALGVSLALEDAG